ncbi:MAG: glycosyltransferase family 2 protein [Spirochaetaceae bacterium]|jgi:chlorobactene glucosyltransferase|nr:glycosyltransferase family 2 protein [Spirochaetaceae bacterium]
MDFSFLLNVYFIAMIVVSAYFFLMASFNIIEMKIRTAKPSLTDGKMVSVLVPARNEEENIERCVNSLRCQTYRNYEILVIDDNSTDGTWSILERLAKEDSRVRIFKGKPLPDDWYGKPFALQQLHEHAAGELLLFTDADTVHTPYSVSWAVTNMEKTKADFVSGYIGQKLLTIGEITTVPILFFLTGFVIPMFLNRFIKLGYFSAAVGQYIVMKTSVFKNIGGYANIRNKTTEDVYLSRYVKSLGYKTEFLDMSNMVKCRMYKGYLEGIRGIGKNIFDFLGKNDILLLLIAVVILIFFVVPFPLSFLLIAINSPFAYHCLAVNVLFTVTWLVMFLGRRINWLFAFLWPVMYINLLITVLWSWFRTISGRGFVWKGRVVR